MCLTQKQNALVVGGLLGDLHIQKSPSKSQKCRLRFCHSIKQREYVDYKYNVFKEDFCAKTRGPHIESEKRKNTYLFSTAYSLAFADMRSVWYKGLPSSTERTGLSSFGEDSSSKNFTKNLKPVKRVPLNIGEFLTDPLALAIWYLDDGTKRDHDSCRIASNSFFKEEHEVLRDCLKNNFSIPAKIEDWGRTKEGKTTYNLAFQSRSNGYKRFHSLVYDIVNAEIPSMLYKL